MHIFILLCRSMKMEFIIMASYQERQGSELIDFSPLCTCAKYELSYANYIH